MHKLCFSIYYYFGERRLRFLVEWEPNTLTQSDKGGWLPIHTTVRNPPFTTRGFQLVFEYGIRWFPKKKGISFLFQKSKNMYNETPFQYACENLGYEKVLEVVEETLVRYSDTPVNITEASLSAAIDDNIHLDCVYFLLRREPDVLQKLLSSTMAAVAAESSTRNYDDQGDDRNSSVLATRTLNSRKKDEIIVKQERTLTSVL